MAEFLGVDRYRNLLRYFSGGGANRTSCHALGSGARVRVLRCVFEWMDFFINGSLKSLITTGMGSSDLWLPAQHVVNLTLLMEIFLFHQIEISCLIG